LTPDDQRRAASETHLNLRAAYTIGRMAGRMTVYGELLNAFDEEGKDIAYYYEAHVAGLDPPGLTSADIDCAAIDCRMSRSEEPRTLRVGLRYSFQ
jgi:hypothetical protein